MTFEASHGKARPTLPRSRALAPIPTEAKPNGNRDPKGRFLSGNGVATGKGWKHIIAKQVGRELRGEAEPLAREAWHLYLAFLRELPHDGAQVRQLVASRARSAVLAGRYAIHAAEVGLDSDAGQKAMALSMQLDSRAERLAVTALDIAVRLAKANRAGRVIDVHAEVTRAFGAAPTETPAGIGPARVVPAPPTKPASSCEFQAPASKESTSGGAPPHGTD